MIVDGERIRLLKTNSLFKGISESLLKPYLKPKYFFEVKEGEIIYTSGDGTIELYLIVEGEVKIKFTGNGNVEHKYLSDFFGEDEFLNESVRNSSAVANTDCVLFKISSTDVKQLSASSKKITENMQCKTEVKNDGIMDAQTPDYQSQDYLTPEVSSEKPNDEPMENFEDQKYQTPPITEKKPGIESLEDIDDETVDWNLEET